MTNFTEIARIVQNAGDLALTYYKSKSKNIKVFYKNNLDFNQDNKIASPEKIASMQSNSIVTNLDYEVNDLIISQLSTIYPTYGIISEEGLLLKHSLKNNGLYFVIDPLDGTKSFVMGKDYFSINVAVVNAFDGECVFGCTFFPALDKMYFTSGVGSFGADFETNLENDRSINIVTNKRSLKTKSFERIVLLLGKKFEIKSIKTIGGAYKICSLFEGGGSNVCISAEPVMEWDIASAFGFFYGREVACYNFEFNNIKFLQKCLQNILVDKLIDNQTATQSASEINGANTGGLNPTLQKETLKSPILHNSTLQSFGLQNDLRSNLVEEDFLVENYIVSNTEVFNYLKSC